MERMTLTGTRAKLPDADIVGIDLGTTNCAVSVFSADTVPTLLPIGKDGSFTVPSCVRWDGYNEEQEPIFTVGAEAYSERYKPNVVYSIKRLMGSGQKVSFHSTKEVVLGNQRTSREFLSTTPAMVSAQILKHLKERTAEFYREVDKCVITVPAYFDQRQIEDTLLAAKLSGWDCKQILKEPTSASYIYSQLGYATNGSVVIYDLGGGTFDVTHMNFLRRDSIPSKMLTYLKKQYGINIAETTADLNDQYFCRVLGTYGNVHLGGDDIDRAFGDMVIKEAGIEFSTEERETLYLRCEEFKKMGIDAMDAHIGEHRLRLSAGMLNSAVDAIFEQTMDLMRDIDMSDVKTIVLVGGSTKSKRLRENLQAAFPGVEISVVLDPDATVSLGAGSIAKAIAGNKSLMYADVLPLPIGILVDEKEVEVCIPRNTSMPYTVRKTYHTIHDNQEQITLHLYQGLSSKPENCTHLGRLTMTDIPIRPAGDTKVDVLFILTGQGTLKIRSCIEGTEREEELVIDNIFDVKEETPKAATPVQEEEDTLVARDDFERAFLGLAGENEEVLQLFRLRRQVPSLDISEDDKLLRMQEYEDEIATKVLGGLS